MECIFLYRQIFAMLLHMSGLEKVSAWAFWRFQQYVNYSGWFWEDDSCHLCFDFLLTFGTSLVILNFYLPFGTIYYGDWLTGTFFYCCSSRFTDSKKYEDDFMDCFQLHERRSGEICNACVLLVKRWKKLPAGSERNWRHVSVVFIVNWKVVLF